MNELIVISLFFGLLWISKFIFPKKTGFQHSMYEQMGALSDISNDK